jgi:hypothetical protein
MSKRDKGYTRMPNALIDDPSLSTVDKVVWLLAASYRDGCTLSTRDIAERIKVARLVVRHSLARLSGCGLISWEKGAGQRRSVIRANGSKYDPINGLKYDPIDDSNGSKSDPINGLKSDPLPPYNNIKKNNKENNITHTARAYAYEELAGEESWVEGLCCSRGIELETMHAYIADFCRYCHEAEITHRDLSDAKRHFVSQLTSQIERHARNQQQAARGTLGSAGRAQREAAIIAAIAATAAEGADTGDDLFDPCGLE